jgi:DUF1680 family protein
MFGWETNYPCCTVNFAQGWSKFVTQSFLKSGADGSSLLQAYLGPISVNTVLNSGNVVNVTVDTIYPFADTVNVHITSSQDFTYQIRIPSWVSGGTLSTNGGDASPVESGQILDVNVAAGETSLVLNLPAEITTGEYFSYGMR